MSDRNSSVDQLRDATLLAGLVAFMSAIPVEFASQNIEIVSPVAEAQTLKQRIRRAQMGTEEMRQEGRAKLIPEIYRVLMARANAVKGKKSDPDMELLINEYQRLSPGHETKNSVTIRKGGPGVTWPSGLEKLEGVSAVEVTLLKMSTAEEKARNLPPERKGVIWYHFWFIDSHGNDICDVMIPGKKGTPQVAKVSFSEKSDG